MVWWQVPVYYKKSMHRKVVVITGSSSGIGKAAEELLTDKGYRVIGLARSFPGMDIQEVRPGLFHLSCDLTDPRVVERCFGVILKQFGVIDILINNAGSGVITTVEDISEEDIEREIAINLKAHLYCTKAIVAHMRTRRSGHIINILSTAARLTYPTLPLYDACKHAMLSITESLSWELRPWSITVTSIEPGAIKTRFGKNMKRPGGDSVYKAYYESSAKGFAAMYKKPRSPEYVAQVICKAIGQQGWKYNTAFVDLVWLWSYKLLPKNIYDRIICHYFNL